MRMEGEKGSTGSLVIKRSPMTLRTIPAGSQGDSGRGIQRRNEMEIIKMKCYRETKE
jgi:hypothetical protein